jgi:hypothetical protein
LVLLENEELIRLNRQLADLENAVDLSSARLAPELRAALESAGRVYRQHGWSSDEAAGLHFRNRLAPMLARHGQAMTSALARAYAMAWPEQPMRVDITAYAGPVGAYTVLEPTHITIASRNRRHSGDAAFEILFHEASHSLVGAIREAIAQTCVAQGKPTPPTLWHAVLFWSTGELVRRELGAGYTPYAYQNGLYERDPAWKAAEPLLARYWRDYLDGRISRDAAIRRMVTELSTSS